MNIFVNTQLLVKGRLDGIGWFTYETIKRITQSHPEHNFFLVFDRKPAPEFEFGSNVRNLVLPPQSRHPFLWFLRFEILLPFVLKWYKADLYVSPDGWMSLFTKVPGIQVLHDLNYMHFPEDIPFFARKYYNILFPRYARKAMGVVTVSNYSKQDIIKTFRVEPDKIDVAYNGCNPVYVPLPEQQNEETRKVYAGGNPYFVYVGALIPRKNIARLFQAFDLFKKQDEKNIRLIIVGHKKWWTEQIDNAYEGMAFKKDVIFLGRLEAIELNKIYAASIALTFVPYFEGFGIPILEAFNSGTAVITSNCTSMPEVAGDAAILADPGDIDSIAEAMTKMSTNNSMRQELIAKSKERAKLFSWDNTANAFWNSIEKVLDKIKKT